MTKPYSLEAGSDKEQRLLEALRTGAPIRVACQYAGIHKDTYYETLKRRPELLPQVEEARATAAIRNLALVQKFAAEDWRAAEAALRLMMPEFFSKNRVEITGAEDGPPLEVVLKPEVSADFVAEVMRRMEETEPQPPPELGPAPEAAE